MSWLLWIVLQWTQGWMYLFKLHVFVVICPRMGLQDLFLIFKEISYCFYSCYSNLPVAVPIYIPTNTVRGLPSLHILCSIYDLQTFYPTLWVVFWLSWVILWCTKVPNFDEVKFISLLLLIFVVSCLRQGQEDWLTDWFFHI